MTFLAQKLDQSQNIASAPPSKLKILLWTQFNPYDSKFIRWDVVMDTYVMYISALYVYDLMLGLNVYFSHYKPILKNTFLFMTLWTSSDRRMKVAQMWFFSHHS